MNNGIGTLAVVAMLALTMSARVALAQPDATDPQTALAQAIQLDEADLPDADVSRARTLYEKASAGGLVEAERRLGALWAEPRSGPDLNQARHWWSLCAEKGDAICLYRLSTLETGAQAIADLQRAADAGLARAMRELGQRYEHGRDVPLDTATAARWYLKAAAKSDAPSMSALRDLYARGDGVAKDVNAASDWNVKSEAASHASQLQDAEIGDALAMYRIGGDYNFGWDDIPEDDAKAAYWYRMADYHGVTAAESLALMLLHHRNGASDVGRAIPWVDRAFAEGGTMSSKVLARLYEKGEGVPVNPAEAKRLRDRADDADNAYQAARNKRGAAFGWAMSSAASEPLDRLIASASELHPAALIVIAERLWTAGRRDEAVTWFYIGRLRWHAYIKAHDAMGDGADTATEVSMLRDFAPMMSDWAAADPDALVADMQKALDWDATHADPFTDAAARAGSRQELKDLIADMLAHKDEIRAQRAKQGLPNART
jgi:TPR repeat protein